MNLSKNVKITVVKAAQADGTSSYDSDTVDMQGFEGVMFVTSFGVAAADIYMLVTQGQLANMTDEVALAQSAANDGDVNAKTNIIDIYKPQERYVAARIIRVTSTDVGPIIAIQYEGVNRPYSNASADIDLKALVSPAEGTA